MIQNGVAPTPPGSNKALSDDPDAAFTKLKSGQTKVTDTTGNLPNDQLAKMFPTPPSLEHPSPADGTMDVDHMKMEPISPVPDMTDWYFSGEDFGKSDVKLDYGQAFQESILHEETKQLLFLKKNRCMNHRGLRS